MHNQESNSIKNIVIVGGGAAGWLTAGLLASEYLDKTNAVFSVTLIESPDIKSIGVGEGTWPTMRDTLKRIGITETDFLLACTASFKQGSKFSGWVDAKEDDKYYHPFSLPIGFADINLVQYWQEQRDKVSFTNAVSMQGYLGDKGLAPKQISTPEYAFLANYGYHLDAVKFAGLLRKHCTENLGVKHIFDHVTNVNGNIDKDIESVSTRKNGELKGDIFLDCTGFKSLLLGEHYKIPFIDKTDTLFNDTALAVQLNYEDNRTPIASYTNATAQKAGWVWDIALPSRRGVGYVYSSAHTTDDKAAIELRAYIAKTHKNPDSYDLRKIPLKPGHREKFWHKNCVSVGMSAGFLEPLEASALVLVELAAKMIVDELPANRELMDITAKRFNDKFLYNWEHIIDFLKLHYVLSKRDDSEYWIDNRNQSGMSDKLQEQLKLWKYHAPWHDNFSKMDEIFSAASHQYVLYGMGFETLGRKTAKQIKQTEKAHQLFIKNAQLANQMIPTLESNRALLDKIREHGLQKI